MVTKCLGSNLLDLLLQLQSPLGQDNSSMNRIKSEVDSLWGPRVPHSQGVQVRRADVLPME